MSDRERFNRLIEIVLKHEGGLSEDPNDPGKITRWGISLRSYPHLGEDGIRNLTLDQAKDIYYRDWWLRLRLNEIRDDRVAGKVLDTCVNIGTRTGIRLLQQALNDVGEPVTIDGLIGPQTIAATNRAEPEKLLTALRGRQAEHYKNLIKRNPKLIRFARGWFNRAYS